VNCWPAIDKEKFGAIASETNVPPQQPLQFLLCWLHGNVVFDNKLVIQKCLSNARVC
jgi:hypothetical protein